MTTAHVKSRSVPGIALAVITKDGKRYEFGKVTPGRLYRWRKWRQNRRIERYMRTRLREVTNDDDRAEFTRAIRAMKEQL